jgi:hypothetical protein
MRRRRKPDMEAVMSFNALVLALLPTLACVQLTGAWRDSSPHRLAPNLSGTWEIDADFDDPSLSGGGFDCVFKQEGDRLTGSCQDIPLTGEVKEANVKWQIRAGQTEDVITYTGTVNESGTRINGRFSMAGKGGRFTASKQ